MVRRQQPVQRWEQLRSSAFLLFLVFFVAALFRIVLALRPGLWVDEVFSLAMATGHSLEHPAADANPALGDFVEPAQAEPASMFRRYMQHEASPAGAGRVIRAVLMSDTSPPLYYLLLSGWTRISGTSDAALRLFSAMWALASLPLIWAVGRRIGGRRTAWIASILFALSPPALYYSGEGRMYSLLWFLGLALAWSTIELARRGPRLHLLFLWILSGAAGLLTHYFFAFVWLACVAWLLLHAGRLPRRHLAAATALAGLLVLPWYLQLPESLGRWRITAGWLDYPLSTKEMLTAPVWLAWSLVSGSGIWGGWKSGDSLAAMLYAFLVLLVLLRRGPWPLFARRQRLLWLWVLGATFGPVIFDLLRGTNASLVARYALGGLPAALLLAGLGISQLRRRWVQGIFVLLILFAWSPGLWDIYYWPPRPWQPFPEMSARLQSWVEPGDLVIVHSTPSGVLGVARYVDPEIPIASWVIRLGQRSIPDDLKPLLEGRCRVALVKVHELGETFPAEEWLQENADLEHADFLGSTILYFRLRPPADRSGTGCPAWSRSAPTALGRTAPPAWHSGG